MENKGVREKIVRPEIQKEEQHWMMSEAQFSAKSMVIYDGRLFLIRVFWGRII